MLVSLVKQGLTGKAADAALHSANITVNKNSVPNDPQSPFVTSGIRLGTPAITTRGFKENETKILGNLICDVLDNMDNEAEIKKIKDKVLNLCSQFPVYSSSKQAVA
jgi:glycine hydroxymethyltransferase